MIVLVTGATAGFGLAIARRFAADGARIIAAGRRQERLEALAAELPGQVLPLALDVADRAAVEAAIAGLPAEWAAIDLLVNNAGHVLNIGSTAAEWPYPGGNVYGATKAFVRQFSYNLRADLHGTKVRVTDIEPGLVGGTEFSTVRFGGDAEKAAGVYAGTDPLTPEDIADIVHWVATRPARVNVNLLQVMPVVQSFGPLRVHKE